MVYHNTCFPSVASEAPWALGTPINSHFGGGTCDAVDYQV